MNIDVKILTVGNLWLSTNIANPNIKELTNYVDCDDNPDQEGNDYDVWKLDVKLKSNKTFSIIIKSHAADIEPNDYESNEIFKDKKFCVKLVKEIFKELKLCDWVTDEYKDDVISWSFTGDCSLWYDSKLNIYGIDT